MSIERFDRSIRWLLCFTLLGSHAGCAYLERTTLSIPKIPLNKQTRLSNPLSVNVTDSEFLWNQIVDTVEDYFRIKTEQRAARDNMQWYEGRLETQPEIGATYLEPWRKDALEGYQRLQSTFQTMRRICYVRVIPTEAGFDVAVEVIKELEDVDRSQYSSEGAAIAKHDGSVVRTGADLRGAPIELGWIRQENDVDLEQRILREILGRVANVAPPRTPLLHH